MTKYLLKRLLHGLVSIVIVVAIVMVLIYSLLNRALIFSNDMTYQKQQNNAKISYSFRKWQEYGYLDYVTFADYMNGLVRKGELDAETRDEAISIGRKPENDSEITAEYVEKFTKEYESKGFTVERYNAVTSRKKLASGGQQILFAHRDRPLIQRLITYFSSIVTIDTIHYVDEGTDIGERGLTFTTHDPLYGGKKFAPAIIGNGTRHKYLMYFDNQFPFFHQNLITISLGKSYSLNNGVDVLETMLNSQGSYVTRPITFPTGLKEDSADDLHTATYTEGSREVSQVLMDRFEDDYTNVTTRKNGMSKIGYSFSIGILATCLAYLLGVPIGIFMARHKEGLVDKIGTVYIVFIMAVPSLAYIFLFKAIGGSIGLPTTFDMNSTSRLMYLLPIISLALPSAANLMKWLRRYMIDQMNSDYVKFARSGGLSENEIFFKHIFKNAAIPIVHGIPGALLGALTGAIITERVYVVPGTGDFLTRAINANDNGVIVGLTMWYALLSVVAIILGDILMAIVDPRISFTDENR
ncbi:ABC transporter permease [Acutalibacter sp. 1XD8-33]|uniref:ABC transporter permease n=1 Tax=Acutalibacter sp. 1XD8-33 TaxID=2320081 RepID=UPI000EA17D5B|nr:ABC transporter permease [Acutalibacter sp. 1XD8-33]RKJ40891.1 ABC transporter permease [Acutalibacter sp. 1XD8-33]